MWPTCLWCTSSVFMCRTGCTQSAVLVFHSYQKTADEAFSLFLEAQGLPGET